MCTTFTDDRPIDKGRLFSHIVVLWVDFAERFVATRSGLYGTEQASSVNSIIAHQQPCSQRQWKGYSSWNDEQLVGAVTFMLRRTHGARPLHSSQ